MTENKHENQEVEESKEEENDSPWQAILIGLGMIAFGVFLYYTFSNMEEEGGSMRMNWILVIAYNIGGKWTVAGILAFIGAIYAYSGVSKLINKTD